MKLEQLMEGVPYTLVQGSPETEINDIIYDSRKAAPGLLFVCIVGTQRQPRRCRRPRRQGRQRTGHPARHRPDRACRAQAVVKVERAAAMPVAPDERQPFGNPARQMTMIGVTRAPRARPPPPT